MWEEYTIHGIMITHECDIRMYIEICNWNINIMNSEYKLTTRWTGELRWAAALYWPPSSPCEDAVGACRPRGYLLDPLWLAPHSSLRKKLQEPPLRSLLGTVTVVLLPDILSFVRGFACPGLVTVTSTLIITYEDIRGLCMHAYDEYLS